MKRKKWYIIKYACSETYTILGIIGVFLAIICLVDFNAIITEMWKRGICVILIFAVAFAVALLKTVMKTRVLVDLENGRSAVIEFGDLFEGEDNIVIPVNDSFDTLVDDIVVAKKSIHGQFIKQARDICWLEQKIEEELKKIVPEGMYGDDKSGKKLYYPLGTTITISVSGKKYYLTALTHFKGNSVETNLLGYYMAILSLIEYLNEHTAGGSTYIPLLGGGLARLGKTKEHELENLLAVLRMSQTPMVGKIHIRLNTDLRDQINLHRFEE